MRIIYKNQKLELQCTNHAEAKKIFGGSDALAESLMSRIFSLKSAGTLKDIIVIRGFHFHALKGNRDGYFSIDVKTRQDPWRIILRPLDRKEEPFVPCHIDEIATVVEVVEISEVSKHYE